MDALKIAHDDEERQGVYIHMARINLKLGNFDEARMRLSGVTNREYAALKNKILSNLNEAVRTNSPPKSPSAN